METSARALQTSSLVAWLCLVGAGCGEPPADALEQKSSAISNGVNNSFHSVVTIGSSHHCTGTLIADRLVLTASHCAAAGDPMPVTFHGVTPAGGGAATNVTINGFVLANHPYYGVGAWGTNDFALVRLNESAASRVIVSVPRLAGAAPTVGDYHTLVGYGAFGVNCSAGGPTGLRKSGSTQLDVIGTPAPQPISGGVLTYNDTVTVSCLGDSGGPSLDSGGARVQGVVGWTDLWTNSNYDAVYRAMDWLGVVAYSESGFWGGTQGFSEGPHDVGRLIDVSNDSISSLKVGPGYVARLWSESGFWGTTQDYTGDVSYVGGTMNDNTSSLQVLRGVTMYRDADYGGVSQTFLADAWYDAASLTTVGNDQITSMRLAPGVSVYACSEGGWWGDCLTFKGWVPNVGALLNNRISSFIVTQQ